MPVNPNRMYRDMTPLMTIVPEERKKRLDTNYYVEGYATTFDEPYLLYDTGETKYYEKIDKKAFKSADLSDVIFQYNHQGRVYARNSNKTLGLEVDKHGLFVFADLSRTEGAKDLYGDIAAGMITKMSWAFTVAEQSFDRETHTFTILRVRKVYDVSAVSTPANPDTEISARAMIDGEIEKALLEEKKRRIQILKIKTLLEELR